MRWFSRSNRREIYLKRRVPSLRAKRRIENKRLCQTNYRKAKILHKMLLLKNNHKSQLSTKNLCMLTNVVSWDLIDWPWVSFTKSSLISCLVSRLYQCYYYDAWFLIQLVINPVFDDGNCNFCSTRLKSVWRQSDDKHIAF